MTAHLRVLALTCGIGVLLSGCGYKVLKAPCGPDEGGTPLAYAPAAMSGIEPEPFRALDACGPLNPI
jgi:uncharacterized protein YceK